MIKFVKFIFYITAGGKRVKSFKELLWNYQLVRPTSVFICHLIGGKQSYNYYFVIVNYLRLN